MKKDNIKNIIKVDDKNQIQENIDKTEEENDNNINYSENDFIRQTNITLVEEPKCNGFDSKASVVANIENNGNISISKNGGAIMITPGNAKYLYSVSKLACDSVELYYITEDKELYLVSQEKLFSGKDVVATKVTESKVVEFLGTEVKETDNGYDRYLKVLLTNGEIEYINYLTTLK